MKLENKVQKYVNHLYDSGVRGTSEDQNGMSIFDEENLTQHIIQATLWRDFPQLNMVFDRQEFFDRVAKVIESSDALVGVEFAEYVVGKVVDYYRPEIKKLIEETHVRSRLNNGK